MEDAGHARRFGAEFVNHAGDFVICRQAPAAAKWAVVERITEQLRLPLDATKTRSMGVPEEPLECHWYPIWRNYKPSTGAAYIGSRPSQGSIRSVCRKINALTGARRGQGSAPAVVRDLNRGLLG